MTYIIAGKSKNKTFLMADCLVRTIDNDITLGDKVIKLESSLNETYFTSTGTEIFAHSIGMLDEWYIANEEKNDFISGDKSINKLIEFINCLASINNSLSKPVIENFYLGDNRLFFINKNTVVYYDLYYNGNNELINNEFSKYSLGENQIINSLFWKGCSNDPKNEKLEQYDNEFERYCNKAIPNMKDAEKYDFQNKFTFVQFDEEGCLVKRPLKDFKDYIIAYLRLNQNYFISV